MSRIVALLTVLVLATAATACGDGTDDFSAAEVVATGMATEWNELDEEHFGLDPEKRSALTPPAPVGQAEAWCIRPSVVTTSSSAPAATQTDCGTPRGSSAPARSATSGVMTAASEPR